MVPALVQPVLAVADRTGDGLPEASTGAEVYVSPIQLTGGGLVPWVTIVPDDDVVSVQAIPYDLDGDGVDDWLATLRADGSGAATHLLVTVSGGPAALIEVEPTGVELESGITDVVLFEESGRVLVWLADGEDRRLADLGPIGG